MKLLAVTFAYRPEIPKFRENILRYLPYVDKLIVWDNTPDPELSGKLDLPGSESGKVLFITAGKNVGIAFAANRAVEYALSKGYTHVLTMDQDSAWEDFAAFRAKVEASAEGELHIFAPSLNLGGRIPENLPDSCISSGMLVPAELFRKVGLFREDYFIDAVDTEFCYRCRREGYSIMYFPDILFHSLGHGEGLPHRSLNYSASRYFHIIRNEIYLWKDYRDSGVGAVSFRKTFGRICYFSKIAVFRDSDRLRKFFAIVRALICGIAYNPERRKETWYR